MKTKVKVLGSLFVQHNEYLLVRIEQAQGLPANATLFTVLTTATNPPMLCTIASTAWTIEYSGIPYDVTTEVDEVQEVDYSQIPEPEMTEQEWEYRLSQIDKENVT